MRGVNKESHLQGQPWALEVPKGHVAIVRSVETTPGTLTYNAEGLQDPTATNPRAIQSTDGVALILGDGTWTLCSAVTGSSAVKETYLIYWLQNLAEAQALLSLLGSTALSKFDLLRWGGVAVAAARNTDAEADVAEALISPLVKAQLAAHAISANDGRRVRMGTHSAAKDEGLENFLLTVAALFGQDTSVSAGGRSVPVEARASVSNLTTTLYRLLTDSLGRGFEPQASSLDPVHMLREISTAAGGALSMLQQRASGYWASLRGRRYKSKTLDLTGVAARTTLSLTEPLFILVAGATKELIIRRVKLSLRVRTTGTSLELLVKTDTADRYTSGGTSRAAETLNPGNAVATGLAQSRESTGGSVIVATAEGGGTRGAGHACGQPTSGGVAVIEYEDGLIVPAGGSLLVYGVTATTAETVDVEIEFEEANVQ